MDSHAMVQRPSILRHQLEFAVYPRCGHIPGLNPRGLSVNYTPRPQTNTAPQGAPKLSPDLRVVSSPVKSSGSLDQPALATLGFIEWVITNTSTRSLASFSSR